MWVSGGGGAASNLLDALRAGTRDDETRTKKPKQQLSPARRSGARCQKGTRSRRGTTGACCWRRTSVWGFFVVVWGEWAPCRVALCWEAKAAQLTHTQKKTPLPPHTRAPRGCPAARARSSSCSARSEKTPRGRRRGRCRTRRSGTAPCSCRRLLWVFLCFFGGCFGGCVCGVRERGCSARTLQRAATAAGTIITIITIIIIISAPKKLHAEHV